MEPYLRTLRTVKMCILQCGILMFSKSVLSNTWGCSVTWLDGDWLATGWTRRGPRCLDFVIRWPLKFIYLKLLLQ